MINSKSVEAVVTPKGTLSASLSSKNSVSGLANVPEWLQGPKGEKGDIGEPGKDGYTPVKGVDYWTDEEVKAVQDEIAENVTQGAKGDDGASAYEVAVAAGFEGTEAQWLASLKGEKGDIGPQGPQGIQGVQGMTGPQGMIGPQGQRGEAFTYDMFTPTQLEGLKGPKGDIGPQGPTGATGPKGDTGAIGPQGDIGPVGPVGPKGDIGAAFTYDDFTAEQLAQLVGPEGPQGPKGDIGPRGPEGPQGIRGETGPQGEVGPQGPKGDTGEGAAIATLETAGSVKPDGNTITIDADGTIHSLGEGASTEVIQGIVSDTMNKYKLLSAEQLVINELIQSTSGFTPYATAESIAQSLAQGWFSSGKLPCDIDQLHSRNVGCWIYLMYVNEDGTYSITSNIGDWIMKRNLAKDTVHCYIQANHDMLIMGTSRSAIEKCLVRNIRYDNSVSGLTADTMNGAIDELLTKISSESGKSAYQIAVDNGFVGTEEEWLASLKGETGPKGEDGYTPVKGVDYFDGEQGPKGDTGATGPQGEIGPQGLPGEKGDTGEVGPKGDTGPAGEPGYSPVKGTDYWTAADKTEIINEVLLALPAAEGVSV